MAINVRNNLKKLSKRAKPREIFAEMSSSGFKLAAKSFVVCIIWNYFLMDLFGVAHITIPQSFSLIILARLLSPNTNDIEKGVGF